MAFACLSARFSFNDFPDFLLMVCRGDLSDITAPSSWEPGRSRFSDSTPRPGVAEIVRRRCDFRGHLVAGTILGCMVKRVESPASPDGQPFAADHVEQPLKPDTQVTTSVGITLSTLVIFRPSMVSVVRQGFSGFPSFGIQGAVGVVRVPTQSRALV